MLVLERKPKEVKVKTEDAGEFLFRDTERSIESGDKAFVLKIETDGGRPGRLFFTTNEAALEFLKTN
jgi:hypothetical protein